MEFVERITVSIVLVYTRTWERCFD